MVSGFRATEVKPIKTVGQRLRAARKRKQLSLEDAERLTKVKLKYLKALEEDRHDLLPTEVYSLGFARCYGEVLGLNTKKLLEQYQSERRSFKSAKGQTRQALAPNRRLTTSRFMVTPRTLVITLSAVLVMGLVLYIVSGIRSFLAPPKLVIESPKADTRVTANTVSVNGETDPVASLTINGEIVPIEPDGKFTRNISVIPGLNTLEFVAINRVGKEAKQTRKILAEYQVSPSPLPSPSIEPTETPAASPSPSTSPLSRSDNN